MPINVICPGCRARFRVSDKFAGQSGACPKCKSPIKIPKLSEQVVVHDTKTLGDVSVQMIDRTDVKFSWKITAYIAGGALVVTLITWILGLLGLFASSIMATLGLLVVTPTLAYGCYWCFRDPELGPFVGKELISRLAICSAGYIVIWLVSVFFFARMEIKGEDFWLWVFLFIPILLGGAVTLFAFEFDSYLLGVTMFVCFFAMALFLSYVGNVEVVMDTARGEGGTPSANAQEIEKVQKEAEMERLRRQNRP